MRYKRSNWSVTECTFTMIFIICVRKCMTSSYGKKASVLPNLDIIVITKAIKKARNKTISKVTKKAVFKAIKKAASSLSSYALSVASQAIL